MPADPGPAWHRPAVQLGAALLVGLLLRLPGLGDGLNHDEAYTWQAFAKRSWTTIVGHYPVPNNHILHSLLVKASAAAFGDGELALRLPALLAGVLAIPATWWLAAGLTAGLATGAAAGTAVLAAWVVALSPALVSYSHVARGYTLVVLFSALAGGALVRAQRDRRRSLWPPYAVALFLAVYTQPSALLLALGLGAGSLTVALRRRADAPPPPGAVGGSVLSSCLAAHGAVAFALVLAYGHILEPVLAAGRTWGVDLGGGTFLAYGGLLRDVALGLGPATVVLAVVGARVLRASPAGPLLLLLTAVSLLVPLAYGTAPQPRGFLFLLPWAAAAAGLGALSLPATLWRRAAVVILLLAAGGPALYGAVTHTADPGWRELGQTLAARQVRDEVLVAPFRTDVEVMHYAEAALQRGVVTTLMDGQSRGLLFAAQPPQAALDAYELVEDRTGTPRVIAFPEAAFEALYRSGDRVVYRLPSLGVPQLPESWQWNAHPGEVEQVVFGASGAAVSEQPGLAVRNRGGQPFRLFSRARFRPPGKGLLLLAAARTDPRSQVSVYRVEAGGGGVDDETVIELNMLLTSPRPLEAVGRDGRLWYLEAFVLPVTGARNYGVYIRGTEAPRQDVADIRVLFHAVD